MNIAGIRIVEDARLTEFKQVFVPKTKKFRIQEKARRNPRNWRKVPSSTAYQMGDTVVMHPDMARRLMEQVGGIADAARGEH